jgi:hypothetical protein
MNWASFFCKLAHSLYSLAIYQNSNYLWRWKRYAYEKDMPMKKICLWKRYAYEKDMPMKKICLWKRYAYEKDIIKMEMEGCYQAAVSYGDIKLRNGDFNILVISGKSLMLKGGKLPLCSFISCHIFFIVESHSHREQPLIMLFMLTSPTFYFYYNVCVTKFKNISPRETTLGIRSNVHIYKYTL